MLTIIIVIVLFVVIIYGIKYKRDIQDIDKTPIMKAYLDKKEALEKEITRKALEK